MRDNATLIKETVPVHEYIRTCVTVKRQAGKYWALCPFHGDTHPSMVIHPRRGFFCHTCNASGSVIDFAMMYHRLDFKDACDQIAGAMGLGRLQWGTEQRRGQPPPPTNHPVVQATQLQRYLVYHTRRAYDYLIDPLKREVNRLASIVFYEPNVPDEVFRRYELLQYKLNLALTSVEWDLAALEVEGERVIARARKEPHHAPKV